MHGENRLTGALIILQRCQLRFVLAILIVATKSIICFSTIYDALCLQ